MISQGKAVLAPKAKKTTKIHIKLIKNREGVAIKYDISRIEDAVFKAFSTSAEEGSRKEAKNIAKKVTFIVNRRFKQGEIPTVEDVQNIVEEVLILQGYVETARNYILYREQRRKLRESKITKEEAIDWVGSYLDSADWEVKENSNMNYSLQGLNNYISNNISKIYWLNKIYPKEIRDASKNNLFHIHDLGTLGAYCCGWDLYELLLKGFGGVSDKLQSNPPKHFRTVLGQIINYFYTLQGEVAGAQAFSNFDTLLAPFIRYDNLNVKQVKQCLQEFLFNVNVPTRVGFQTPFTNITLDLKVSGNYKDMPVVIGGQLQKETYKEFQPEMDLLNKVLCEVFTEGDANGKVFTFPIPTYNITKDFDWDNPNYEGIWHMTAKYGLPYFSNFISSDMSPEDARSMCLAPEETLIVKIDNKIQKIAIGELVKNNVSNFDTEGWAENHKNIQAMSFNPDTYKIEWVNVKKFLRKFSNKIYNIETMDGKSMRVSGDHLVAVYTENGIINKKAENIGEDDILLTTRSAANICNTKILKIDGLEIDEEMAFFMGLFIADGIYCYDTRKQYSSYHKAKGFQISFHDYDGVLMNKINLIIQNKFHKTLKFVKDKRWDHAINGIFNGTDISRKLINIGLKKRGGVPEFIFNCPYSIIKSFLDGFFAGDGYEDGREIHINDKLLAKDLILLYTLIGVPTTYSEKENSQVIRLQHVLGRGSVEQTVVADILYNRVPQYIVEHSKTKPFYDKTVLVCKSSIEKHDAYTRESWKILTSDMALVKVRKINIEEKLNQVFYDIELEKNHYFVHSMGSITHNCCRLRLDKRELYKRGGGLFGANPKTGSLGVVTLNLPRIAYLSKTRKDFFARLKEAMDLAKESLEIKRKTVELFTIKGLYPYCRYYLQDVYKMRGAYWANHFSTIGLVGGNEACQNFLGCSIADKEGKKFMEEVLKFMRDTLVAYQDETGNLYNLEATPAEGTSYRLAKIDKDEFPDIITAGENVPYYTNSTQLPVNFTDDFFEVLDHQDSLQIAYTGGTVVHGFIGEEIKDPTSVKTLIKTIFSNYRLPYMTVTPTFSVCPVHGYIAGEHFTCPKCIIEQPCQVYSRVVGYLRPVENWHVGKQEEFKQRLEFNWNKTTNKRSFIKSSTK